MEPIISIKNLSVIYDKDTPAEVVALSNINLDIFPGEFVIVFGPSGCGKSTLLYAISGAERRMAEGELWIKGKNLKKLKGEELTAFHRQSVGMVFQAYNLIPTVNVFDNIILPLVFKGVSKNERIKKGNDLVSRFNIAHLAKTRPNLLSGGQQQRVGIARALVNDTDIILADEPTGNLDSQSAFAAMDLFDDLNLNSGKTIIMVTHESQYLPYASRIVYMKDGSIIKEERQQKSRTDHIVPIKPKTESLALNMDRLITYLELNLNSYERLRFNDALKDFIDKTTNKEKFFKVLDAPFKQGGVGLYRQTAMRIPQEVENIAVLSELLHKKEHRDDMDKKTDFIFTWLFADYKGEFLGEQKRRIKNLIGKIMLGKMNGDEFQKELDAPINEGGAGLNFNTAKNAAKKIGLVF